MEAGAWGLKGTPKWHLGVPGEPEKYRRRESDFVDCRWGRSREERRREWHFADRNWGAIVKRVVECFGRVLERFSEVLEGLLSSRRLVGTISTNPGTYKSSWC